MLHLHLSCLEKAPNILQVKIWNWIKVKICTMLTSMDVISSTFSLQVVVSSPWLQKGCIASIIHKYSHLNAMYIEVGSLTMVPSENRGGGSVKCWIGWTPESTKGSPAFPHTKSTELWRYPKGDLKRGFNSLDQTNHISHVQMYSTTTRAWWIVF